MLSNWATLAERAVTAVEAIAFNVKRIADAVERPGAADKAPDWRIETADGAPTPFEEEFHARIS